MFADLDETIRQLLILHVPLELSAIDVSFDAPDREWSGRLSRPTVNCFLYDVRENLELRQQVDWDVQTSRNGVATIRQMPVRIDATYQVTAWARASEDEHELLWRVLAALFRNRTIPQEVLHGALVDQPFPVRAQVAHASQSRSTPAELWQALDNRIRPTLTYTLSLALDPEVVYTAPLVFTRAMRVHPPKDQASRTSMRIGGHVRERGRPVHGAAIELLETGSHSITDEVGRFALTAHIGACTLLVEAPECTLTRTITVPAASYDVDL